MDFDPVLLSRIQFAFVVSFHIIFPAFTIGLAAWLATIDGMWLATGNPVYRRVFDFWLKVFALSFGMGVVSGIVMAFQFCTNWSMLAGRTGSIQGPLLGDGAFTAFLLEAAFFVVMVFGHFTGDYVHRYQSAKFAAIEARWKTQQPASEVLIGIPDPSAERNLFALEIPKLGSFIASGTWDSRETGLDAFPQEDRPPV